MMRSFFLLLLSFSLAFAKPPELTERIAKAQIEEILGAHATYQHLDKLLIKRALGNFIEELDPLKIYFLEDEITTWINPPDSLLEGVLQDLQNEEFTYFTAIYEEYLKTIKRRQIIEDKLIKENFPEQVRSSEFRDMPWAKTEKELEERLLRMHALQFETTQKFSQEGRDKFTQRLTKRRRYREKEFAPENPAERHKMVLAIALKAIASSLDSQTNYCTPREAAHILTQVQLKLYGIGAQLRDDLNGLTIMQLIEDGPALKGNKIRVGDKIIAVNGEPVMGLDFLEAVEKIRGPQGTVVKLTLLREKSESEEETLDVDVVRGEIVFKEARMDSAFEPYGNEGIAILRLHSFYQDQNGTSASDLRKAFENLEKEHKISGVVLDLRDNAGGILPQARSVAGLFMDKGIVVSIKNNKGEIQHLRNTEEKPIWKGPLVIMTNRGSASAAEIVAQTLQDYGRALVIGDEETYGKGTFQTFTLDTAGGGNINPKGEYKVTRGCYYTVSGRTPQKVGVKADIVVPGILSNLDFGEKYAKYPLENDTIEPNFDDHLSDVPFFQRRMIIDSYRKHLQRIESTYSPFIEKLRANATARIASNESYQAFLREIGDKEFSSDPAEIVGKADLQQQEVLNILKDLIFMMKMEEQKAA